MRRYVIGVDRRRCCCCVQATTVFPIAKLLGEETTGDDFNLYISLQ